MPFSVAALKTELNTDPAGLGYPALLTIGNDDGLAAVLNFVRDGTTACPVNNVVGSSISLFRDDIHISEVLDAITTTDFPNLTQLQVSKVQMMFAGQMLLDAAQSANYRTNFGSIFAGMSTTQANLTALASRKASRAEQLFGLHFVVTAALVAQAINS